jgi:DNA polymerase-3 subunit delta
MIIPYPALNLHLKKGLGSLYILTGECPLLLAETTTALIQAWGQPDPFQSFWLEVSSDWEELFTQTHYPSLFSPTQGFRARFHKKALDAASQKVLNTYASAPAPQTLVLIQAPDLPPTALNFLAQNPSAHAIQIPPLKGSAFIKWIEQRLTQRGIRYDPDVPKAISHFTEGNTLAAHSSIELLDLLKTPTAFTLKTVQNSLTDAAQFPLYALSEACLAGKLEHALRLLRNLQQQGSEPLLILWWLTKALRQLMELSQALKQGQPLSLAFKTLKIWSSQESLYIQAQKRLETRLSLLLKSARALDLSVKSNVNTKSWEQFERMVLMFCEVQHA